MGSIMNSAAFRIALLALISGVMQAAVVRGRIERSEGYPAPYMRVTLNGPAGESNPVYTGNDGQYYFRDIPAGTYVLEIWNQRDRPTSYRIEVREPVTEVPVIRIP